MSDKKKVSLDTMANVGQKTILAGREYVILPVTISDMHYILNEEATERFIIPERKELESGNISWTILGLNVQEPRKTIFLKMVKKYVYYRDVPVTEEMIEEHNWSFRDIATFLYTWIQEVSE